MLHRISFLGSLSLGIVLCFAGCSAEESGGERAGTGGVEIDESDDNGSSGNATGITDKTNYGGDRILRSFALAEDLDALETVVAAHSAALANETVTSDQIGDVVACVDDEARVKSLELFEYFESQQSSDVPLHLGSNDGDIWERAAALIEEQRSTDAVFTTSALQLLERLQSGYHELDTARLRSAPMVGTDLALPSWCYLLQAAIWNDQGAFLVDREIWYALNEHQRIGLILHETLKAALEASVDGFAMTDATHGRYLRQLHIRYVRN